MEVIGEDSPRGLSDFEARFSTERACRAYQAQLHWPGGFEFPRCEAGPASACTRQRLIGTACRNQASVTADTIFQGWRLPLRLWFRAILRVTAQKNSASALGLRCILSLGQFRTAWTWLHELRRAMVRPRHDRLSGCVEVDEVYVGGWEKSAPGRSRARKSLVAVGAEEDGHGIGRIGLRRMPDASAATLEAFTPDAVEPGSRIPTSCVWQNRKFRFTRSRPLLGRRTETLWGLLRTTLHGRLLIESSPNGELRMITGRYRPRRS